MKFIYILILSLLFSNHSFLDKLNQAERKPLLCSDNAINDFGILGASKFNVVFTKANKTSGGKTYQIEGYLIANDSFKNKLSEASVKVGSLDKNNLCHVTTNYTTDNNGNFSIQVNLKESDFLQFHTLGFISVMINLKN